MKLAEWSENGAKRVTEDLESLEMHSAVRNVMRLYDRIKDFEKKVLARQPELSSENCEALIEALAVLAQVLGPFAPHIAEELWLALRSNTVTGVQMPWPVVSFGVPA